METRQRKPAAGTHRMREGINKEGNRENGLRKQMTDREKQNTNQKERANENDKQDKRACQLQLIQSNQ
jgi:hypothetical protein